MRPLANSLRADDRLLLGMDGTSNLDDIWNSYHDRDGEFEKFMRNGLAHSNRVLQHHWYNAEDWDVVGAVATKPAIMHRFVFRARREVSCAALYLHFKAGEEIDCYEAFKYGPETMRRQFALNGLKEIGIWTSPSERISKSLNPCSQVL
jgi:uncharacterized SAM-dependent methyltransferase